MFDVSIRTKAVARNLFIAAGTTMIAFAVLSSSASAATEIGSRCTASGGLPNGAVVNVNSQSVVIPANGVITKWGTNFVPTAVPYPVSLLVLRGSATPWTLTGQSNTEQALSGPMEYATRISVTAGDRIGMGHTPVFCPSPGDEMALGPFAGLAVGGLLDLPGGGSDLNPSVWASIEPDVDGDGFGDETQDLCPQGAAYQAACPVPVLSVSRLPSATGFRAIATTSIETTVVLNGSFKRPAAKGKKAKTIKFKSKKFKTRPGEITSLSLKWPRSLTKVLNGLSSNKKLLVKVSVTADGLVTDRIKTFKIRLNGRG